MVYTAVKTIYTAVYRSIPFELAVSSGFGLKFEFERYLAVYRGRNRYRSLAVRIQRWVKNPGSSTASSLVGWGNSSTRMSSRRMNWSYINRVPSVKPNSESRFKTEDLIAPAMT
jgi:hypothetical protein